MIFKNEQANIGPITKKLDQISPGLYAITGGYLSQPGEWNIAMAAQRPSNYDLNYKFTSLINSSSAGMSTTDNRKTDDVGTNNLMNMSKLSIETINISNPFTLSAITLAVVIGFASFYFYNKSKQKLRKTIDLLDQTNNL
jgi:hypothetical protein